MNLCVPRTATKMTNKHRPATTAALGATSDGLEIYGHEYDPEKKRWILRTKHYPGWEKYVDANKFLVTDVTQRDALTCVFIVAYAAFFLAVLAFAAILIPPWMDQQMARVCHDLWLVIVPSGCLLLAGAFVATGFGVLSIRRYLTDGTMQYVRVPEYLQRKDPAKLRIRSKGKRKDTCGSHVRGCLSIVRDQRRERIEWDVKEEEIGDPDERFRGPGGNLNHAIAVENIVTSAVFYLFVTKELYSKVERGDTITRCTYTTHKSLRESLDWRSFITECKPMPPITFQWIVDGFGDREYLAELLPKDGTKKKKKKNKKTTAIDVSEETDTDHWPHPLHEEHPQCTCKFCGQSRLKKLTESACHDASFAMKTVRIKPSRPDIPTDHAADDRDCACYFCKEVLETTESPSDETLDSECTCTSNDDPWCKNRLCVIKRCTDNWKKATDTDDASYDRPANCTCPDGEHVDQLFRIGKTGKMGPSKDRICRYGGQRRDK